MKIELTKSEWDGVVIALCTRIESLEARNDPEIYAVSEDDLQVIEITRKLLNKICEELAK